MNNRNASVINSSEAANGGFVPFLVAGAICFAIAVVLGSGSWYLFNSNRQLVATIFSRNTETQIEAAVNPAIENAETTAPAQNSPVEAANPQPAVGNPQTVEPPVIAPPPPKPENVVNVAGGEIVLGGGDTKKPLERRVVGDFAIAETEVTNAQYAEFLKATNHQPPAGWKGSGFPNGTENFPVTNVSWRDAVAYCNWLGKKLGMTVRLPTDAEWELAARGKEGYKYPWGNEWDKEAAVSKETKGKVSPVKSYPLNRSPFGAFDMAGNVWEWTQTKVEKDYFTNDGAVKDAIAKGRILRIVKGGSAEAERNGISAQATFEIPETSKINLVGFRYLIEIK